MPIPSVRVTELSGSEFLLDVREADEWQAGHAEAASFVPMSGLIARLEEVPKDTDVVVVCKSGSRSAQVTAYLNQNGWTARNLDGGMHSWVDAGHPMISEDGSPPRVL
ncbi:MAG: rhodanese-like domain-containing protein [Actinomycetota bacterium]